ncbi:MAG: DUF3987 domain-containing protein [Ardenticatenaceae bacterium]
MSNNYMPPPSQKRWIELTHQNQDYSRNATQAPTIIEDVDDSSSRSYITTHTPHAWLDRYIEYSRALSPRGFGMLHEATGLWLMSSVVAGRAIINFGGRWRHTSLMFIAVGRSSVWAKSHTIGIAEELLIDAGQDWRFLPTLACPQAIVEEMRDNKQVMAVLREMNRDGLSDKEFKALENKLADLRDELGKLYAHEGQRAWHIKEFSSKIISDMMTPYDQMASFSGFLREINEKVPRASKRTRGHGKQMIKNPYLAVIAETRPANIRPLVRVGAPLWSNGFLARFAIIAPTSDETPSRARVAYKRHLRAGAPHELTSVLANVNQKLGRRKKYYQRLIKTQILYAQDISDAMYDYEAWINQNRLDSSDLDSTYARLVFEQSPKIAMLLALFDGSDEIQMHHYQRSIEVCERIRRCTEDFYKRITESSKSSKQAAQSQLEDQIIKIIWLHHEKKNEWPTLRDIRKRTGNNKHNRLWSEDTMKVMDVLRDANQLEEFKEKGKRASRYRLIA